MAHIKKAHMTSQQNIETAPWWVAAVKLAIKPAPSMLAYGTWFQTDKSMFINLSEMVPVMLGKSHSGIFIIALMKG